MNGLHTLALSATLLAPLAAAQSPCGAWTDGFAMPGVPLNFHYDLETWKNGATEQLYACGAASGIARVLRREGRSWTIVHEVPGAQAMQMESGDDGSGQALYVGLRTGLTTQFERFDGTSWTSLGSLPYIVLDLTLLDIGSGMQLFALGAVQWGPNPAQAYGRVLRWDGLAWNAIGSDLPVRANALGAFDDGSGLALYIGGYAGLTGTSTVARWNGTSWDAVGALDQVVLTLATYPAPGGAQLLAGVQPPSGVMNQGLRRLDSGNWTVVSPASPYTLDIGEDLAQLDLGSGPQLFISSRRSLDSLMFVYDGTTVDHPGGLPTSCGRMIEPEGLGASARMHSAGHDFRYANGSSGPLRWCGGSTTGSRSGYAVWTPAARWDTQAKGFNYNVRALTSDASGSGQLFAAGICTGNGDLSSLEDNTARWNGTSWANVSYTGQQAPLAACTADLGTGPKVYVGVPNPYSIGSLVHRLDGSNWTQIGGDQQGDAHALTVFDVGAGPSLAVGGQFTNGAGNNIAAWNGSNFSSLGGGMDAPVFALASHADGSGSALYAGGSFTTAGGVPAARIARWNGTSWSALGIGLAGGDVAALCSFDGQLFAGGTFTSAGGVPVSYLARWNGTAWSDVPGAGANGAVLALHVHDDGRGPALYVGGGFSTVGGITAYDLARFDGTTWEAVAGGLDGVVRAFASHDDDGDGDQELFVGGDFQRTATLDTGCIARLEGCPHHESFCFGDGSLTDHTTPCPCGNSGAAGHGCANSFVPAGALLVASGNTSPDTMLLSASDQPQSTFSLFMQHDAADDRVFHDGVLCAGGTLTRLRGRNAVGGVASFPNPAWDSTITLSQRGQVVPGSGVTRYYSCFYRNASTTFCPPATANVSNGIRVHW